MPSMNFTPVISDAHRARLAGRGSARERVMRVRFDRQSYAIALPNDSPLRVPINRVMIELIQGDWWRDTTAKYLGKE
jgi:ABC-type amino acid transport substrate-binding protein